MAQDPWKIGGEMTVSYEKRMHRVLDHIHDNPGGDLSLDALADVAAMSRFHWHRVFHAMQGETAAQAVRRIRLHRASVLLVHGPAPVAAVAKSVGYPNVASFTRAFVEGYGVSPTIFRNRGELRPFSPRHIPEVMIMYPIEIRNDPKRRLAAMPHAGAYHEIGRAFEKLSATMAARDLFPHAGAMVAAFYDDPSAIPAADLRSHAGFEMSGDVALAAPLEEVTLPAGPQGVLTYTGPYAGLPAAYDQLYSVWLPKSGREPADSPSFEIYRNSPMDTAPEALITEICVPLR
ncbi:MAG: AraC family transcriptional regulator [Paracoccaceae bacterium]